MRDYGYIRYSDLYVFATRSDYWKVERTYYFHIIVWTESYDDPPLALKFDNNDKVFYFSLNKGA
ncbi:hypothetical protein [Demequina sediminicola]|uniref:hypothetical protein n=1 Tax=Demequina sediminicola TaxID=1095026 RepID=UPI000784D0CC|nr:hypothetical protein [Demequina sediminicola]